MASLSLRHIPESEMSLIFVSISNEEYSMALQLHAGSEVTSDVR